MSKLNNNFKGFAACVNADCTEGYELLVYHEKLLVCRDIQTGKLFAPSSCDLAFCGANN